MVSKYTQRRHRSAPGAGLLALALALSGCQGGRDVGSVGSDDPPADIRPPVVQIGGEQRDVSFDAAWKFQLGDVAGASNPDFDDRSWRSLDLPHDWQIEDLPGASSDDGSATAIPDIAAYLTQPDIFLTAPRQIGPFDADQDPTPLFGGRSQGWTVPGRTAWYRKAFDVSAFPEDRHFELRFDGIMQQAEIWLNGELLESSVMGYLPVYLDITPYLRRDEPNVVAVRVHNARQSSRWYNGSGIYRHTWLTVTGPVRIPTDTVYVTTPEISPEQSLVRIETRVSNLAASARSASVTFSVSDPAGRLVASQTSGLREIAAKGVEVFQAELTVAQPELWSPDTPALYTSKVEVLQGGELVDSVETPFGIRTFVADPDRGLLLNGEPIKLKGANVHHDHGPLGAVALYRSEERRIEILKAAGFNAVRTGHMPPTPEQLEICDRLGMIYYNELYDAWDIPKGGVNNNPGFASIWPDQVDRWVRRDRNHPSAFVWGIGNEIFVDPVTRGAEIAAAVRALDDTRFIARGGFYDAATFEYADVGDEHYSTDNTDVREANPGIIIMQSESYPSTIYQDWAFENANPWAFGNFVWTGWDHIGESGLGTTLVEELNPGVNPEPVGLAGVFGYPWYLSYAGDIDLIGQPKPQNYWRRVIYGMTPIEVFVERPFPAGLRQAAQGWAYFDELKSWTWEVPLGQSMRVRVYTSGDSVELLLNGASLGSVPLTEADQMRVTFDVPYAPGDLLAVARKDGQEIGRQLLRTVGEVAAVRLRSDLPRLTTSRDDLAHVLVEIVDAQGHPVPDAVEKVEFEVSGAGSLFGVANGNPHNVDSFQQPRRHTFQGKALAIIRPGKSPGEVILRATVAGLEPALLRLPVDPIP